VPVYWEYVGGQWSAHRALALPAAGWTALPASVTAPVPRDRLRRQRVVADPGSVLADTEQRPVFVGPSRERSSVQDDNAQGTLVGSAEKASGSWVVARWRPPTTPPSSSPAPSMPRLVLLDATDIDGAGRILVFGSKTVRRTEIRLPLVLVPLSL